MELSSFSVSARASTTALSTSPRLKLAQVKLRSFVTRPTMKKMSLPAFVCFASSRASVSQNSSVISTDSDQVILRPSSSELDLPWRSAPFPKVRTICSRECSRRPRKVIISSGENSLIKSMRSSPRRVSRRTLTCQLVMYAHRPFMVDARLTNLRETSASKSLRTSVKLSERTDLMRKASSRIEIHSVTLRLALRSSDKY